jgi:hypothetical protein
MRRDASPPAQEWGEPRERKFTAFVAHETGRGRELCQSEGPRAGTRWLTAENPFTYPLPPLLKTLRGWGNCFRSGNAAKCLRGIPYATRGPPKSTTPETTRKRVREIRMHGLKAGLDFDRRGDAAEE